MFKLKTLSSISLASLLFLNANLSQAETVAVTATTAAMDHSVKPGDNFNRYVNGLWEQQAKIPDHKVSVGIAEALSEISDAKVLQIIEAASKAPVGSAERKIGDFYQAYLNQEAINQKGLAPIQAKLDEIQAITDTRSLSAFLGKQLRADVDPLNATNVYTSNLFGLWIAQGFHDHRNYTAYLLQGGLGLPDRDYYLAKNPTMQKLRTSYQNYVAKILKLANYPDADKMAAAIFELEMKIARGHASREVTSDVHKADNSWRQSEFAKRAPGLDWAAYFQAAGLSQQQDFVAWHPQALKNSASLVKSVPVATWKAYLSFHSLNQRAGVLPQAFFAERFAMYSQLTGAKKPQERSRYAVNAVNAALGEEVGKIYVKDNFSAEAKQRMNGMVENLLKAFSQNVQQLSWMSEKTKAEALEKIKNTYVGIGYPDTWRDYSGLQVDANDAFGNLERSSLFDYQYALAKLGKPVDVKEWCMNPQLVNAVNMPMQNALNFPAAYLQAPYFDMAASDAANYGAVGATIGHEISHSFDNLGSMFDSKGELRNWWTKGDFAHFNKAAKALVAQFNAYQAFPDLHVNGAQTLGENIADLAGLKAAYQAYRMAMQAKGQTPGKEDDQEFFISYARSWRGKMRDETLRNVIVTNEHAPGQYRILTVRNLDAWYTAFDIQAGQAQYLPPAQRVKMW